MRWATYRLDRNAGEDRVGLVEDSMIYTLERGVRLIDLLGDDGSRLAEAGERARRSPDLVSPVEAVHLRSPIPNPPSIRDFSTFVNHIERGYANLGKDLPKDWNDRPGFYFTNPNCVIGSGETVRAPGNCVQLDFELEAAVIIGAAGRDIDPAEAEAHIAGLCIFNDCSARDLQRLERNPTKAKDFASVLGPYLVTPDELETFRKGAYFDLEMTAAVNGVPYGRDSLANASWSFSEMIAYASRATEIVPGEVFGSGTAETGCILELSGTYGLDRFPWLQEGDEVVLEVQQLGQLRNRMTFGPEPRPLR